jgi:hypothetical protein
MSLVCGRLVSLSLEHMTEVATARWSAWAMRQEEGSLPVGTGDLDTGHEHRFVLMSVDCSRNSVEESRPSAARCATYQLMSLFKGDAGLTTSG